MKHRTPAKRITSILLGLQMVLLQPLCSLAEIPQQSPTVIAGARLSEDQLTEGELVYFGVSGLTLKEATDSYEIAIYREGNLDQEASVTVHTLDISALYNEDYRLLGDDITEKRPTMKAKSGTPTIKARPAAVRTQMVTVMPSRAAARL